MRSGWAPALVLILLMAGCAPRKAVRLMGGRAETLALLTRARTAQEGLATLAASGEVSVSHKGRSQSGDFQMWFERPDRMRIDLAFLFFRVASAVISGDSGEIYFPTKHQSYYGKIKYEQLEQNLGGVSLAEITDALQGRLPLPADSVLGWDDQDGNVLFQYRGNKTVLLDLEKLVVLAYEERDSADRILIRGKADGFRRIQGFWFPSRLVVERPQEPGKIDIRWREVRINEPIPETRFELKLPEGVERIPVG